MDISYGDNCFDKVCSSNTIYFWKNPDQVLRKIHRILKPGGTLLLGFEDRAQLEKRNLDAEVFRFYSAEEMETLLRTNGFSGRVNVFSKEKASRIFHCASAVK